MTETFSSFDAADYLKTDKDITAYLNASAEEGDAATMAVALGTVARARNVSQLARDTGMTREGIYKALSPDGNPGFATVVKWRGRWDLDVAFRPRAAHLDRRSKVFRTRRTEEPVRVGKIINTEQSSFGLVVERCRASYLSILRAIG